MNTEKGKNVQWAKETFERFFADLKELFDFRAAYK
jgi:hypothetical protein